jgi:hypothetical protein
MAYPIAGCVAGYFTVGGWKGAIGGGVVGIAMVLVMSIRRAREVHAAHHRQLELQVASVNEAYSQSRFDDLVTALDQLPHHAFDQGCQTCLELLRQTEPARQDLGAARWLVNEYGYPLATGWVIARAYGGDRERYERERPR